MAALLKKLFVAVPAPPATFALHRSSVVAARRLFSSGATSSRRDDEGEKTLPFSADVICLDLMETRPLMWVSKEDETTVQLKMAMPGFGKEHVKVWVDKGFLMIKGNAHKEYVDDDDKSLARYSIRIDLPTDDFKVDQISAQMRNGVLKLKLPKTKCTDDTHQIKVE